MDKAEKRKLKQDLIREIVLEIRNDMKDQKPYPDRNITLNEVSGILGRSPSYISRSLISPGILEPVVGGTKWKLFSLYEVEEIRDRMRAGEIADYWKK